MRWITLARALPVVVALSGPINSAPAGDDLFMRSYQPYLKSAPAPTAPSANSVALPPVIAPAPTYVPPAAAAPVPVSRSAPTRSRITWLKGGRGPAVGLGQAELPPTTPPPGQTVAAALSVVASPPDYFPAASKGLARRLFRSTDPDVPPGLPRGAEPVAMVPPEPLETSPASTSAPSLARTERRAIDGPAPTRGYADLETSRSSYAATPPRPPARSLFAPVRPRLADERADRLQLADRRQADQPAPFLIARPAGLDAAQPVRRVDPSESDLEGDRHRDR